MKKIKVAYCKYKNTDHTTPTTYNYFIHTILKKYYDVEISKEPDYVFYHESTYDYLNYDCIRIFYTAENVSPNFNLCDYAIAYDYMDFGDRYHRFSSYLIATFYNEKDLQLIKDESIDITKQKLFTIKDLDKKTEFCSFVYSNYNADDRRKTLLDTINTYKKVNSGGKYLNNVGGPVESKLGFEMKHKFSMAIENSCRDGYTTDRIVCGFMANTIPIYWGNPMIGKEFNTKRFINCHDYASFDDVLARIKEIDNDDELFIKIMNEPLFAEGYSFDIALNGIEKFVRNIIDQPIEQAPRRTINQARAWEMEDNEKMVSLYIKRKSLKREILATLYQPFKKIKFFESLKFSYFKKRSKK
jgi:hypothetical protein